MGIKTTTSIRKAAAGVAAAVAVTGVTLFTTTGSAAAAPMGQGRVMLCSQGSYSSMLSFHWPDPPGPATGGRAYTTLVAPGTCGAWNIPKGSETVEVMGQWHTSVNQFTLGTFKATSESNPGVKVYTKGTTGNAAASAYFEMKRT
ncbi:hypothetical protein ACQEVZ_39785 [Dactylosporangium sp. CA-152071]|uniref:hypothetical protein n=1 Tax=Dactylosporangium sp. CA-152071 TaxID=3239933 RepID=UPI003D94FAD4